MASSTCFKSSANKFSWNQMWISYSIFHFIDHFLCNYKKILSSKNSYPKYIEAIHNRVCNISAVTSEGFSLIWCPFTFFQIVHCLPKKWVNKHLVDRTEDLPALLKLKYINNLNDVLFYPYRQKLFTTNIIKKYFFVTCGGSHAIMSSWKMYQNPNGISLIVSCKR